MNTKTDGSRSSNYFCTGLQHIMEMPPKKSWRSKKRIKGELRNLELLVAKTDRTSLEWLKTEIAGYCEKDTGDFSNVMIVIVDYFKDSMIQEKYILDRCLTGLKVKNKPELLTVEFDERDYTLAIEDEYNQCFSYKYLTKQYKSKLDVVGTRLYKEKRETSKSIKTKRGREYADSPLV